LDKPPSLEGVFPKAQERVLATGVVFVSPRQTRLRKDSLTQLESLLRAGGFQPRAREGRFYRVCVATFSALHMNVAP